jgi:protein CpxP
MFDLNSRARHATLGALLCAAAATLAACAHTQQAPPSDSAAPRGQAQSQNDGDGSRMRHGGGRRGDMMLRDLNLTKEQHDQVRAIRDRYRQQAESLRKNGAGRDSTSREQFRSMMKQEMSDIRAVLTPDQQKKFDDKMAKMKERREHHDANGDHDGPGDHDAPPPAPPAPPAS